MEEESSISSSGLIENPFHAESDSFSDYTKLKSNGFNRIFKAQRYGKWFILKGLKPEYQSNPFYLALLEKEFDISLQLDHPNIVKIIDKRHDKVAGDCIVMEYIDGVTLKEFLQTPHNQDVYDKIIGELLNAMSYYHSKQIIHRDLKPSNILITNNGNNVKIIDFGLSDTDCHAILKQPAGSEKYAAPEQYKSDVVIDCRADIYSAGLIIKLILKDKTPYKYKSVIRKCTQADRDLRYDNAEIIIKKLQRFPQRKRLIIELCVFFVMLCAVLLPMPQRIKAGKEAALKELAKSEINKAWEPFIDSLTKTKYENLSDCLQSLAYNLDQNPKKTIKTIENKTDKKYSYYFPELETTISNEQVRIYNRAYEIAKEKYPKHSQ